MRLLTLLLCCFAATALQAQDAGEALAYRAETTVQEGPQRFRNGRERTLLGDLDLSGVWAGPTYKYGATGDDFALMRGGFGGLEFSDDFFLGYGGWHSRDPFTTNDPIAFTDDSGNNPQIPTYDFRHGGFIFAYAPFSNSAIHPRLTTVMGPGRIILEEGNNGFRPEITEDARRTDRFFLGQATIGLELNLFQWFRLGVDGGYRFAAGVDNEFVTAEDVSGLTFQIEARFGFSW